MDGNKKNVYLVQVSAVYGEKVKTAYLPYASGCLAAYAFQDEAVREHYRLGRFIFIREDIDKAVEGLDKPYLVGFSSYIWNMEYNRRFAEKLKIKYPDAIVLFGGHNVKPDGSDLSDMLFADIIMHGEGEITFHALLSALQNGTDLSEVNNISYRKNGEIVTTAYKAPADITDYPSPYTEGYFDGILRDSDIAPSVVWETNRGCPNRCAFCDWGALKSKVRMFPDEKIEAELQWMVKNKVEYVYCADANFGLFDRDIKIADRIIELKNTFGYPQVFKTNYTKNKDDVVFQISQKLIDERIGKSPTLSFQSLSHEVLQNIGRSNMELDHFKNLMSRYAKAGIPVYSELILGLPGETYTSFVNGIGTLLDCNQHTAIGIYPCELLPNSLLGSDAYIQKFGIRTVKTVFSQYHIIPNAKDVPEYSTIIVGTSTMNLSDWKRAFLFSVTVQALHNMALTRAFAVYLNREHGVSYVEFYEGLIRFIDSLPESSETGAVFQTVKNLTDGVATGQNSFAYLYGENEKLTWTFEEYMFIALAKVKEAFYADIMPYLQRYAIEKDIFDDLLLYQKSVIKSPFSDGVSLDLHYDFYNYFRNVYTDCCSPLEKRENTLVSPDKAIGNWDDWARYCVWYGRRDDNQLYTGKRNFVNVIARDKRIDSCMAYNVENGCILSGVAEDGLIEKEQHTRHKEFQGKGV